MIIIANFKGFTLAHPIMVLDNDKLVNTTKASIKDMPELLCHLANQYNCQKVVLTGSKKYTKNVGDKLQGIYKAKYADKESLNIEYITK